MAHHQPNKAKARCRALAAERGLILRSVYDEDEETRVYWLADAATGVVVDGTWTTLPAVEAALTSV